VQVSHEQLKKFLIGNLDEKMSEAIGVQIISDPGFKEKLEIAENDLIEDFLEKNLTPVEETLFYENFLVCDDRVNDLKQLSWLKSYAKNALQTEILDKSVTNLNESFWTNLKTLFSNNFRPATALLTIILVLFLGAIIWISQQNSSYQPTQLEKEFAELNQKDLSNPSEYNNYTNISLISGTLRDAAILPKLNFKTATEKIYFRLPLPISLSEKEWLNAEVLHNQKTIFTQQKMPVYKNPNGQEVKIMLPKLVLNSSGQYQIKLVNPNSNLAPFIYSFAVE
jgi:hypothetical protein